MENVPLTHLDQASTHASRNPQKKVIAPRKNYVKKSAAEKATAEVQRVMKKERKALLQADINSFMERQDDLAKELAEKYHLKVEKTRQMLSNALVIRPKRRVNLWNALILRRGKKLNEELDEGVYENIDEDELFEELEDVREVKAQGSCSSNKAAALDYEGALARVREEMGNLHERCGTMAFAFFTRGHVHDSIVPGWIESQGSLGFLNEVLEITPAVLLRKFELWACAKDRTKTVDTMASIWSECVNIIIGEKMVGASNVTMCYEKYDTEIVERYSVALRGWPEGLTFCSPAKITIMEDARMLEAHVKARREKVVSGEITVKKRKTRSDKGKPRGSRSAKAVGKESHQQAEGNDGEDSEGEKEPPKKRARKSSGKSKKRDTASRLPPLPKSNEFVNTDDDDND
ncbi:hypothetical protein C0992_000996 [Termitomyces sp. T32_za158]|nr:hypothetical protein C0992_000996 [Termitomyces sp. T32_za158]